jgi:UPF0716 family protein affecting phage T7 exclusion
MKRFWPLTLIVAGLLLMTGGFVYDVMFAGIPYQDPTPEMSARYAYHSRVASMTFRTGAGVFAAGSIAGIIRRLRRPGTPQ